MKFRGSLCLALIGLLFLIADPLQRAVVAVLVRLMPSRRERLLSAWVRSLARIAMWIVRYAGGARIPSIPTIPVGPGVLILMNHQSLMDIPVVHLATSRSYPRVVTRRRYAKGIPLISYMLRLYDHPLVDPGENAAAQIAYLRRMAAEAQHPIVIYPEGNRTRDGEIRPFRTAGLKALLSARPWEVYLVVTDGFWKCARIQDFLGNVGSIRAKVECMGPFSFAEPDADADAFIIAMRDHMCNRLREMRQGDPVAAH